MNSGESARSAEATAQFGPQPRLPDSEPMEARQKLVDFTYPLVNLQKTMENHHFEWENPLFQWSFSIAMLVYQRVWQFATGHNNQLGTEKKCPKFGIGTG
jgi:hypothetical protein